PALRRRSQGPARENRHELAASTVSKIFLTEQFKAESVPVTPVGASRPRAREAVQYSIPPLPPPATASDRANRDRLRAAVRNSAPLRFRRSRRGAWLRNRRR